MPRVTFVDPAGGRRVVDADSGETLLEVARRNGISLEGACEGALSCSTCHVVVDPGDYTRLPAPARDEQGMLDLAFGLTPTSRLACQVTVSERLEGLTVVLPEQFAG